MPRPGFNDNDFIITLPRCHDRFNQTMAHLAAEGLNPTPFIGFDGAVNGLRTDHVYEVDHPGSGYHIEPKLVSMAVSHYALWRALLLIPGESFVIFEDDVRLEPGWFGYWEEGLTHLPPTWDLIFIGSCCLQAANPIWGRLVRTRYALCTHAYCINRKALPILIEKCDRVWTNIDLAIAFDAMAHLECYAFQPRLALQEGTNIPP